VTPIAEPPLLSPAILAVIDSSAPVRWEVKPLHEVGPELPKGDLAPRVQIPAEPILPVVHCHRLAVGKDALEPAENLAHRVGELRVLVTRWFLKSGGYLASDEEFAVIAAAALSP
jgi:hypothetical protein